MKAASSPKVHCHRILATSGKILSAPRGFSVLSAIALLMACVSIAAVAQTRVRVSEGMLEGSTAADGVVSFKGVPFAAPPIGNLRWRPPQLASPWTGVRPARAFPLACEQDLVRSQPPWTEEFMPQGQDSEDCLYLNIWAPALKAKPSAALPVYVFIHGGAFHQGATSIAVYDGAALAAKGVVVVTVQYRLGVFGFLALPALTAESPEHASGNYGLLDCLAALRWIHQNIAAFGGDPSRVTVGGQSAGAAAVHDLIASPLTRGLVEGAIAESGSSLGGPMKSLATAEQEGQRYLTAAGVNSLAALRELPAERLVTAATGAAAVHFGPIADGWSLPQNPTEAIATGHALDVPILTGMQADEGSSSPSYAHTTVQSLQQTSARDYGSKLNTFEALYPFQDNASASAISKAAARDRGLVSMYLWASLTAQHQRSPIYTYLWAHAIPWPEHPEFGAFHSSEVPYVFGTLDVLHRPFTAGDRTLAADASGWWVNFISSGNPNGPGLPHWQAFDPAKPETMQIDTQPHMRPLMTSEQLAFWTSVLTPSSH